MAFGNDVARRAGKVVVFEGYDGSGKSTLISELRRRLPNASIRVVGRKAESQLVDIAKILEREDQRPDPNAEILLRIAVEFERLGIVSESLQHNDIVVCDRGFVSLVSWLDYLGVERAAFESLLVQLGDYYQSALTLVCEADFETCWTRSSQREQLSRKDRLGKEVNRRYFEQYDANIHAYAASNPGCVMIDTLVNDISGSGNQMIAAIEAHEI
ncbi:dTMP kinase [Kocuria coralli]|nr:AAA family ATPase [Kocuria coralli]